MKASACGYFLGLITQTPSISLVAKFRTPWRAAAVLHKAWSTPTVLAQGTTLSRGLLSGEHIGSHGPRYQPAKGQPCKPAFLRINLRPALLTLFYTKGSWQRPCFEVSLFELILYMMSHMDQRSPFLPMDIHCFQHCFLKRLFFLHWNVFTPL